MSAFPRRTTWTPHHCDYIAATRDSVETKSVAYDPWPAGGGFHGSYCISCGEPIACEQSSVRVEFVTDPHGHRGLTGQYHTRCSGPFQSMARVINQNWFGRF